jgi:alanyl-tRNA synthetase
MTGDGTKKMTGNEIREMFLRFFESKKGADGQGHRRVRSSSLVPHGDTTLLFTNAGMNQFKDVFLGLEKRDYLRATSSQKCVRAGGKHNDLENVGFTKRHHTFFEMLGNFSFGDYFKKDAIAYAWELVTSPEWFSISKDKLYVTVFGATEVSPGQLLGSDHEAKVFWINEGVPKDRVFEIPGLKDNFWAMGDTGPCGPCSEIFYDMGPEASEEGHQDCAFPCDCGRYVEIWNLVFMQFNRDAGGTLTPLPKPCVDTGMGLERVAAVLQGKISNFETDLFQPLLLTAATLTNTNWDFPSSAEQSELGEISSLQVIADHSRAVTFLITDGILPANEGRGYVLRKIIRRAIQHGRLLGRTTPFLFSLVDIVCDLMGTAYPEIVANKDQTAQVIHSEEIRFARTLDNGLKKVEEDLQLIASDAYNQNHQMLISNPQTCKAAMEAGELLSSKGKIGDRVRFVLNLIRDNGGTVPKFSGYRAFRLYDTYGLPIDFIRDVLRDLAIDLDEKEFEQHSENQKFMARASWKGGAKDSANPAYAKLAETFKTEPCFYHGTNAKDCRIEAIFRSAGILPAAGAEQKEPAGGRRYEIVSELKAGEVGEIVLDRTAIYAESGGQVADTGAFYDNSESQLLAEVTGAFYPVAGLVAHKVVAKETLRVGDRVAVVADAERRARIIRNHSGTHLVNAALRNILGTHVKQSGSLNAPERLRFDFSHFAHVDAEELRDIEQQVNDEIRLNTQIETNVTSLEEALASGALAFFGDKYPEHNVRVVTIPDPRAARGFYSKELCGGTHVQRTGDIGVLKIVSEESVAAGVRRIEAVTGIGALEHFQRQAIVSTRLSAQLNVGEDAILGQVEKLSQTVKHLEKELEAQKRKGALSQIDDLAGRVQLVKGIKVISAEVQNVDREGLRQLVDTLRQKLGSGVVALGMPEDGKVALIAGVTKDLTAKVHAGKLMQALAPMVGGKGGGRPDLAEAGGKDTTGLKLALESVPSLIEPLL